jgi:hypothetical protein
MAKVKTLTITHMPNRNWKPTDNKIANFMVDFQGDWTGLDLKAIHSHIERCFMFHLREIRRQNAKLTQTEGATNV